MAVKTYRNVFLRIKLLSFFLKIITVHISYISTFIKRSFFSQNFRLIKNLMTDPPTIAGFLGLEHNDVSGEIVKFPRN